MDTNKLKRFATLARNILIQGVSQRLLSLGFTPKGEAEEEPQKFEGGAAFMGEVVSTDFYNRWMSLQHAVKTKGIKEVVEEAAYTWFNRLVAIRIMVKNDLLAPVLAYESDGARIPILISEAEQGRIPQMSDENKQKLNELLNDPSQTNEQFRILIVAFCHDTPIINKCFGTIADYTELLLPNNILAKDGFIDLLNSTDYINDEDYHSPELIGWLYQFYISEKKDDVFASFKKGQKAEAEDIPAATQIFTPNWIVKYMVQNTVGRIYLDNNPYSDIKEGMKYLVESNEATNPENIFTFDDIHDLTCADLACGSGHILNECFDILYQIYKEEAYSSKKAIEDIFKYNITGIDLDTRAKQLAQFALLMKACQKDNSFVDAHCMPHVYDMPEPYEDKEALKKELPHFLMTDDKEIFNEVMDAFTLMDDAQTLGSIIKFNLSERTVNIIKQRTEEYENEDFVSEETKSLLPYMDVIITLTKKYGALIMNPPYMKSGNMNSKLSEYVKQNYKEGKADLFSTFMIMGMDNLLAKGKMAQINMQSWMFISTFEKLRINILKNYCIDSLLHLGAQTFDELSGEVVQNASFVLSKSTNNNPKGIYYRLVDGENCKAKEKLFLKAKLGHNSDIEFSKVPQNNFTSIPCNILGYWISNKLRNNFSSNNKLADFVTASVGIQTGDNDKFMHLWQEVNVNKIEFNAKDVETTYNGKKWFLFNKGGSFRKWEGNNEYIVDWRNDGQDIKENSLKTGHHYQQYDSSLKFKPMITWSRIASKMTSFRIKAGYLSDMSGFCLYPGNKNQIKFFTGFLNSIVARTYLRLLAPTLNFMIGPVTSLPILRTKNDKVDHLVDFCVSLSKFDWDAHETSWDFKENELLRLAKEGASHPVLSINGSTVENNLYSLPLIMEEYKAYWKEQFMQLHANEEELNREFIDIYGLQDELSPDVPLDEITILQQGEKTIENNELVWHEDVIIKQLISYAIGCMMGRYSIDKPGLILANQGEGIDQYKELIPNSRFEIDDDGIIPLMASNTEFTDAATKRFKTWLTVTFGEEALVENLNYIEKCLGKTLDAYFVKDFWKDHKKMYQNRPIYWLFSSAKGAFQCLVYMHRMNPYTAEKIRTNYLLPHIEWLVNKQNELQANAANLSARERKELDGIVKQIDECREYHDRLHIIADQQISFDLDDGVVVNYAKFGDVLQKIK